MKNKERPDRSRLLAIAALAFLVVMFANFISSPNQNGFANPGIGIGIGIHI